MEAGKAASGWLKRQAPLAVLVLALAAAAAVLLSYGSGLTFFQDTWDVLMHRRAISAAALLDPHNEHIVVLPVAIDQLLLRLFGMNSMLPEQVVLTALLALTAALVFVYVRRRLGPWPALFAAAVMAFLGPAWQDLLWTFQIGFVGSALFGVAMLLALEDSAAGGRRGRRSDLLACLFLALSIGFSSLGLAFAAAALVDLLQRRREGWRRAYVALVPLALYAVWYLGWGRRAENHVSLHNVLVSPRYLVEGFTASLDSVLALSTILGEGIGRSHWGLPLLLVLLGLVAYSRHRGRRFDPRLWPVLAAALVFWLLAAFSAIPGREAHSSRYLYIGALFLLLIAADLLKGLRPGRWALLAGAAVCGVVIGFNLVPLREGRDFFRSQTALTRADLGAIEIARRTVEPSFVLPPEVSGTPYLNEIEAGNYLRAVREYGSPAYTAGQLARAPLAGRSQADVVLANALPLTIESGASRPARGARCAEVSGVAGAAPLALAPGTTTVELAPGGPGAIRLRRFSSQYPLSSEGIAGGSTTTLRIPADAAARPWQLLVEAPQGARVCR